MPYERHSLNPCDCAADVAPQIPSVERGVGQSPTDPRAGGWAFLSPRPEPAAATLPADAAHGCVQNLEPQPQVLD